MTITILRPSCKFLADVRDLLLKNTHRINNFVQKSWYLLQTHCRIQAIDSRPFGWSCQRQRTCRYVVAVFIRGVQVIALVVIYVVIGRLICRLVSLTPIRFRRCKLGLQRGVIFSDSGAPYSTFAARTVTRRVGGRHIKVNSSSEKKLSTHKLFLPTSNCLFG